MKRTSQNEVSDSNSKEAKISDDEATPIEFNDLCDNVINIILCDLELQDLANISDTNSRLRNIAASVFSRRYGNHVISFGVSIEPDSAIRELRIDQLRLFKNKMIPKIYEITIWFKILRNFGKFIKFIRAPRINTDSLEILNWKFASFGIIFNKTLTKLHKLVAFIPSEK